MKDTRKKSIRFQFVLANNVLFLLVGIGLLIAAVWIVLRDKRTYAYEMHAVKTFAYLETMNERIRRLIGSSARELVNIDPLEAMDQYTLNRMPMPGEIFFRAGDLLKLDPKANLTAFVGRSGGKVMAASVRAELPTCHIQAICYVANGQGELLISSHPNIVSQQNFMDRAVVGEFLKSGMRSSFFIAFDWKKLSFQSSSFLHLPKTNLVIFLESDGLNLTLEGTREFALLLILFLLLALIQALLASAIATPLVGTINELIHSLINYGNEKYRAEFSEPNSLEGSLIEEATIFLGQRLRTKDLQVMALEKRLERWVEFQQKLAQIDSAPNIISHALDFMLTELDQSQGWTGYATVLRSDTELEGLTPAETLNSDFYDTFLLNKMGQSVEISTGKFPQIESFSPLFQDQNKGKETNVMLNRNRNALLLSTTKEEHCSFIARIETNSPLPGDHLTQVFINLILAIVQKMIDALSATDLAEKQKIIQVELGAAGTIQSQLEAQVVEVPGYQLSFESMFASKLSGDWFQVSTDKSDRVLAIAVADVTGHGVVPSQVSVASIGFFKGWSATGLQSCAEALKDSQTAEERNSLRESALQTLCRGLDLLTKTSNSSMLQSALFMLVDLRTHEFSTLNAAHANPLGVQIKIPVSPRNPHLGLLGEGQTIHTQSGHLEEGQGLLIYTDGLVENFADRAKRGLIKRISKLINSPMGQTDLAREVVNYVTQDWPNEELPDDVTVLTLQRTVRDEPVVERRSA